MGKTIRYADKTIGSFKKIFIEDPRRAWTIGLFLVILIVLLVLFWGRLKALLASLVNKTAGAQDLAQHMAETGERTTLTNAKFQQLATVIYGACKGWGTDEDAIYGAFYQLNNTADFLKLENVFGLRDGHDLDWWMRSELSPRDLRKLNEILANKGIEHAF